MSARFLTRSFDSSRRKKIRKGDKKESLWATEFISLTLQFGLGWFLSDVSSCMRALGIFEKDTLLSLVVLKSQGQGDDCYNWSTAPGLTRATGLKDSWAFPLSFPTSRYITWSLGASFSHLDHVCVVKNCYGVLDKGSRTQIWVEWGICRMKVKVRYGKRFLKGPDSILDFSGHMVSVSTPLLCHCSTQAAISNV